MIKKHFNKELAMNKENKNFERSTKCWICNLNYIIPIVFHNLKNYDVHLIMQELNKFYFKINIIPNGLEIYGL